MPCTIATQYRELIVDRLASSGLTADDLRVVYVHNSLTDVVTPTLAGVDSDDDAAWEFCQYANNLKWDMYADPGCDEGFDEYCALAHALPNPLEIVAEHFGLAVDCEPFEVHVFDSYSLRAMAAPLSAFNAVQSMQVAA